MLIVSDPLSALFDVMIEGLRFILNHRVGSLLLLSRFGVKWLRLGFLEFIKLDSLELLVVHSLHHWLLLVVCGVVVLDDSREVSWALWLSYWFVVMTLNFLEADTFRLLWRFPVELVLTGLVLESVRFHRQTWVYLLWWFTALWRVKCFLLWGLERWLLRNFNAVIMDDISLICLLIEVVVSIFSHYQGFLKLGLRIF